MKNTSERNLSKDIDHRDDAIGPAWIPTVFSAARVEQWQEGVCSTGSKRVAADCIVKAIGQAQHTVIVSSFILSDETIARALLERAQRGIRVYVLLAAARAKKEPREDEDFDVRMYEAEKALLKSLGGYVLVRTAEYFHAKVVLVDAPTGPGFLLTANLTTEALNRNEELAMELLPDERVAAHRWLGYAFWELAQNDLPTPDVLDGHGPKGWMKLPSPAAELPVTAPGSTALREAALSIVERAQKELWVASFGWSNEHPVVQRIIERAKGGVSVMALARVRPTAMKALVALRAGGATVLGFPHLHAKALWNDRGEALVMSANLERRGLDEGFEMGVRVQGERAEAVRHELEAFAKTAQWKLVHELRVGDVLGKVQRWNGKSFDPIEVVESNDVDAGRIRVPSVDHLEFAAPTYKAQPGKLAHRTSLRWIAEVRP